MKKRLSQDDILQYKNYFKKMKRELGRNQYVNSLNNILQGYLVSVQSDDRTIKRRWGSML
jgi:hypothetical protein